MTAVQLCPKCAGTGVMTRPPGIPADQSTWVASSIGPYRCDLCKGRMALPSVEEPPVMHPDEVARQIQRTHDYIRARYGDGEIPQYGEDNE